MDYLDQLDKANVEAYARIKEMLVQDMEEKADTCSDKASPTIQTAVREAVRILKEQMVSFSRMEKETVPAPRSLREFINLHQGATMAAFDALGQTVGRNAENTDLMTEKKAQRVYELAQDVLGAIDDSKEFLVRAESLHWAKDQETKHNIETIEKSLLTLAEIIRQDSTSSRTKEQLAKVQKNGLDMLENFHAIYETTHNPQAATVLCRMDELYSSTATSIHSVMHDISMCVQLKKAAILEKEGSAFSLIAKMSGNIVRPAQQYMKTTRRLAVELYSKGGAMKKKFPLLKSQFNIETGSPYHNEDVIEQHLAMAMDRRRGSPENLRSLLAKEMLFAGMSLSEVKKSFQQFSKSLNNVTKEKDVMTLASELSAQRPQQENLK